MLVPQKKKILTELPYDPASPFMGIVAPSPSHVQLFVTPWMASPSFTISGSLLRFMSIESVIQCNHLILCHPLLLCLQYFSGSGAFPMSWVFTSVSQSIGATVSGLVLPMKILGWFSLELTGLISLLSMGLSIIFSSTTLQKHQFFGLNLLYSPTLKSIHDHWKNRSFDYADLYTQNK